MDYIDKRNQREKIAKSIIKRWNVVYTAPQPIQSGKTPEELEAEGKAMDILDRLAREHQADEDKKRQEIENLIAEQEQHQVEIERILHEKQDMLEQTIDGAGKVQ